MAMVLVNVAVGMRVVRHDSSLPAPGATDLKQDRVLDWPSAGTSIDDLGTLGTRNRMNAFAILIHGRNLSAASD
jgi:hypothetical protein